MQKLDLDDRQLEDIARRKVTCPFMGPAVRRGVLAVSNTAARPMAAVEDVAELGDRGGGDLGRRVLKIFATGNHRRVPGPSGRFDEAAPDGMMSLDLAGSQGAHPGDSRIMLDDPARIDSGRFSREAFDRLAGHAVDGRLSEEAVGRFIAENIHDDGEARVLPVGRLALGIFGVADEVLDSLLARLRGRRTAQDEAELLERLTKLAGEDNLMGSAGEYGLLFAFFANRTDGKEGVTIDDVEAMMAELRLPEGWETWPKRSTDWVHATTRIAAAAVKARIVG